MQISAIHEKLMQSVHIGLAIVNYSARETIFTNDNFRAWFQPTEEAPLGVLIENPEYAEALAKMEPGDELKLDIKVKQRRRELALQMRAFCMQSQTEKLILIETQNNTRIKELESMIQSYSSMVERNERELKREKQRAEKLLLNVMPKSVFEELREFGVTAPTTYESASVLMLDFIAFTEMNIADDPAATVAELNDIFTNFDRIVEQFGCERIKTIGDAYMAVAGLPEPNPDHARVLAKVALLFVRYLERRNMAHPTQWRARIGLASGPIIGSIIGVHKYVYDIFGPAVNMASRMERRCEPMEIVLCEPMAGLVSNDYQITSKGREEIKGFGETELFSLGGPISGYFDAV